jgi:holo-[acyl-carrier protein] synthase
MIIGIGNDLIDISRIEKTIKRFGNRFIQRIFTKEEKIKSEKCIKTS